MITQAVVQLWEESERGWGVRPDLYSAHLSGDDCQAFKAEVQSRQASLGGSVPDEYTRERGGAYLGCVDAETYLRLIVDKSEGGNGIYGPANFPRAIRANSLTEISLREKAVRSLLEDFANHTRKTPDPIKFPALPYAIPPLQVGTLLGQHGYSQEVVVAGLLHDHLEDLPELWTKQKMATEFGEQIATLVDWVSEQKSLPTWEDRKQAYMMRLKEAPVEAKAICCADKIVNMRDSIRYMEMGFPTESFLKRSWGENSLRYHQLAEIMTGAVAPSLMAIYNETLAQFDRLGVKNS